MEDLSKEESSFIFKLKKTVNKTIHTYGLIEEGDRILIGLSGGKDSLALVEILGEKMKIFNPRFSLLALHVSVDNIPYQADLAYLEEFCRNYHVPFIHRSISFDASEDNRKSPCFLCSWHRRKVLFEMAKENGCRKIALGHHMDDVLETLLMNMTFQGAFGTMPPVTVMNKFDMKIIRPLCLNREEDMRKLAEIRQYKKQQKNCPYEKTSHRSEIKGILKQLEEMNPDFRSSMWVSMENIQCEYLPRKSGK
ncbi:MAG: tRNA 2-thiocytidine biosynthesis TtcA family protein [Candidatus Azobacteroides sp.]|nr:tRNA 2-thiocytidine biosynthesis TtcA family protein [Candidatus Azobacteroides sp.]